MKKYRKKPVIVEAVEYTGFNIKEIKDFVGEQLICEIYDGAYVAGVRPPRVDMRIKTLEGDMKVSTGDYIIKGVNGEFYPCKPEIFNKTYEEYD